MFYFDVSLHVLLAFCLERVTHLVKIFISFISWLYLHCSLVLVIVALVCYLHIFRRMYGGFGCVTLPMPVPSPDKSGGSTSYQKLGINKNVMAIYCVAVM
jgi:hypothetical protein